MNLRHIKRRCAWLLAVTAAITAAVPTGAMADIRTGSTLRTLTVPREEANSPERADLEDTAAAKSTPSNAHVKAVESFNKKVTFVGIDGKELTGDELNIPETEDSFPYLSQGPGRTKGNIDLKSYGYTEKEFFLKGTANVYSAENKVLKVEKKDKEYVNRIIMFQPEDMADFSGVVYIDILNASSKVDLPDIWRRSYDYYMRSGHIYIGITSKDVNVESLKRFDPERYEALTWEVDGANENGLFWDMLAQVGSTLKAENSPLLYGGKYTGDVWTYVTGQSQSGFYVNTFVNNFAVANHMPEAPEDIEDPEYLMTEEYKDTPHIFDGFLNMVGGMTSAAINSGSQAVRTSEPVAQTDVPFILMVGENDYNPAPVRDDSDEEDNLYRHYVVAGASHSQKIFLPDMTDEIQIRAGRPAGEYPAFKVRDDGKPHTVSDMNMDVFVNGALWNLHQWASEGIKAPYGPSTDEIEGKVESRRFIPDRDEYGNMTTGIMSPQLLVPVASYYGGANGAFSTDGGSMVYLDPEVIGELYSSREDYLEKYEAALDKVIEEGWILEEDKDLMMELAQSEPIFGNPVKHTQFIEEAMAAVPGKEELSKATASAEGKAYTDSEYLLTGEANMYGVLRANEIYRRRMYSMPYTNYARVCVPEDFTGEVVIDLIGEGEEKADVTELMKAGKAYVGITADPAAAAAKGGSWEIPFGGLGKDPTRPELGLVWDIISQTVNSVRQDGLVGGSRASDLKVTLGYGEKDQVIAYTYGIVFENFDGYAVDSIASGEVKEAMALNSLDTTVPVSEDASIDDNQKVTGAHVKAVESFNKKVTFVGIDGKELTGDELNIPETEDSFPYLSQGPGRTKGNIDLKSYGYTEKEFFLKGTANVYSAENKVLKVEKKDKEYVNRIIMFQPEDMADFSGVVYIDILNASSKVDLPDIWRRSYDYYMRSGHIYIGITSKDVNVESLKRFDPERYEALTWEVDGANENGLFWDMLAQVGSTLKAENSPLLYGGKYTGDVWTYVTGQSQSGFYVNTFVNNFAVANHMPEAPEDIEDPEYLMTEEYKDTPHIFDGFLNVVGGMANAAINSGTQVNYAEAFKPVADTDVPFILLVGENDYNPGPVKDDSDEEGNLYRHYVVAGASHSQKIFLPDMTDEIQIKAGRPAGEYPGFKVRDDGKPHTVSDMNMDVFVNGALWNLHQWAAKDIPAPYGPSKDEIQGKLVSMGAFGIFSPERDEYGNMTTGILSPQLTVPVASYYGGVNGGYSTDGGSMVYLDQEVIEELYSSREDYLEKYEAALDKVIEEGWILEDDKELMMELAQSEPIFGNPVKHTEFIEEAMATVPEKEELSKASASADGKAYTDSEYLLTGEANMYGVLRTNEIYRRRMYSMPYTNYARVCVPEDFNGQVVIDLLGEGEEKADVTELMKAGKAYVGITGDPAAVAAKGGSWEIPFGGVDKPATRPEPGLVWDIISQTVNSARQDGLVSTGRAGDLKVTLGYDEKDQVTAYTYGIVFENFDGYAVDDIACGEVKEAMSLNSLDTTVPVNEDASFGGNDQKVTTAHIKALESFNKEVVFVGTDGRELTGEERNIPETEDSFPYLSQGPGRSKGNIDLKSYGYTEKEYFLKGTANVYSTADGVLKVDKEDAEYVNRIIMFQPEDMSDFSGVVYIDILNASSKVDLPDVWRRSYDYYMRGGHIYIGITSKDVNVASLKRFDPDRYDALTWKVDGADENGLFWDMLAQVGSMLKAEKSPLLYGGEYTGDVWTYVTGQSQSGFYVNTFVNNFSAANHIAAAEDIENPEYLLSEEYKETPHIFDGFLNVVGGMANAAINSGTPVNYAEAFKPVAETDVPFILLVGENDYNPGPVRDDSDDKDNLYRHYVVAGASHSQKIFLPDMTDEIQIRAGRPAGEYPGFKVRADGKPHTVSDMNMDVFVNGALWNLHQWAAKDIPAPHGPSKDEIKGNLVSMGAFGIFSPERDEYGNMTTGILSPQITVPVASYYGGVNGGYSTDGGSMVYLDENVIQELYSSREDYLEKYEAALDQVIEEGWILEDDKELMMELAQSEPVFENPVKHTEFIEAAMAAVPEKEKLSGVSASADGRTYTESEYLLKGEANFYGVLHTNKIYRRRMYSMPYTNYARVCVPAFFTGNVVIDLIGEGEEKADVTQLMKAGTAYVGITADPAAAAAKGGSWEIPFGGVDKPATRPEPGLVWDIISQTVNSVRQDNLLNARSARGFSVTLGCDENDQVAAYTYGIVFEDFDGYAVNKIACGEVKEAMALNSLDTTIPVNEAASFGGGDDKPTGGITGGGSGSGSSGGGSRGSSSSSRQERKGNRDDQWKMDENGWWFRFDDGTWPSDQWVLLDWNGTSLWYYFNAQGYMVTGWFEQDGNWYYLHAVSDGSLGGMYTGWHQIDGQWYYFHDISDGTRGKLLVNTTTPDGYQVGADGAWVQ